MEQYRSVSGEVSRLITKRYSTSFSIASSLFGGSIRPHIYNIYGLVRIADEIVDTYSGSDALQLLDSFEKELQQAMARGYSTNPVIQAFVYTASTFDIGQELISPFFQSMRVDTSKKSYSESEYKEYIYGSAEVIGLMCLKVFCMGDHEEYRKLMPGAKSLGSAFQKVNFLRDMASDKESLGRYYFPIGDYDDFDDGTKDAIIKDIQNDFNTAKSAINQLPSNSRIAVTVAYKYYLSLLRKLKSENAARIKLERVRVNNFEKLSILGLTLVGQAFGRRAS